MWRRALQLLPLVAMMFAANVGAAIIQITVTGTVTDSDNDGGLFSGFASGPDALNGETATLTFWYDTAAAPADSYAGVDPATNSLYVREGYVSAVGDVSWIRSSATIGGVAVPYYAGASGNYYNEDRIALHNGLPGGDFDSFNIIEYAFDSDDYVTFPATSVSDYNELSLANATIDFLNGLTLNQVFTLNAPAAAYIQRAKDSQECSTCPLIEYKAWASIEISAVTATQVPEPGTLALLGLGLAGLAATRRRRQ